MYPGERRALEAQQGLAAGSRMGEASAVGETRAALCSWEVAGLGLWRSAAEGIRGGSPDMAHAWRLVDVSSNPSCGFRQDRALPLRLAEPIGIFPCSRPVAVIWCVGTIRLYLL